MIMKQLYILILPFAFVVLTLGDYHRELINLDEPARQFEAFDEPARQYKINGIFDSPLVGRKRHIKVYIPFPTDNKNTKDQHNSKKKGRFSKRNKTTKGGSNGKKKNGN